MSSSQKSKSRVLWVVSELFYPEETSTGHYITKIAEGLARRFTVKAVCSQPTYSKRGVKAPAREVHAGVEIYRAPSTTLNKDFLPFRLINIATISLSLFFQILFRIKPADLVFVVTNPPLLPFLIALASRLRGVPYVLIVHDVYPDVFVATGILSRDSWIPKVMAALTKSIYRHSEKVVAIGRDMRTVILNGLGSEHADRVVIIENWADLGEIFPGFLSENRFVSEAGLSGKFVIQHLGNMGRTHDLAVLLEAAERLQPDEQIHFSFIGSGAKKAWLENEVHQRRLRNVSVYPQHPRERLSDALNACHIAVISFLPGMVGISVPSRMYNIMAAGRPILAVAEKQSELALVVSDEHIGWVVEPGDAESIVQIIKNACSRPDELARLGQRARTLAESTYTYENAIQRYVNIVEQCRQAS